MSNSLKDLGNAAQLVSLPDIYLRLKGLLEEPDYAMAEVAVLISYDPGITARLLRLANSSFYGFSRKVETVSHAITLLGVQHVHDIVLATAVADAFSGIPETVMDMQRFWYNSVYCAVTARQLAVSCVGCDKERLFVYGLLHDIGHLVMYQAIPDLFQKVLVRAKETYRPLFAVEREMIGLDYGEVGANLVEQWSLAEPLGQTIRFHIEPQKAVEYPLEASLVHLGSLFTKAAAGEGVFNEGTLLVDPCAWDRTTLNPEMCSALSEQINKDMQEVIPLFV